MKEGETQDKMLKLPACVDSPAQIWTFFLFFFCRDSIICDFFGLMDGTAQDLQTGNSNYNSGCKDRFSYCLLRWVD